MLSVNRENKNVRPTGGPWLARQWENDPAHLSFVAPLMVFFSDSRSLPPFPQNPARRAKGAFWHSRPYESTASPPVTLVEDDEGKMSVSGKPKHSLDVDRKDGHLICHDVFYD